MTDEVESRSRQRRHPMAEGMAAFIEKRKPADKKR
jgi:hypothetical protein